MSVRRLLINQPIPPNAHVLSVDYVPDGHFMYSGADKEYRELIKEIYKTIHGTWGYTKLAETTIGKYNPNNYAEYSRFRGYLFFADSQDVLQVKLRFETKLKTALVWPTGLRFQVHEVIEDDT